MKFITLRFAVCCCIALLSGCDTIQRGPENLSKQDYTTIKVNSDYAIDLPKYMDEGELHEDASLQYQHLFKETYAIIIDEDKLEAQESISYYDFYDENISFIDNYIKFQVEGFDEGSQIVDITEAVDLDIDGLSAKQFEMSLEFEDLDENIFYVATFFESDKKIYMLLHWTLEGRKDRYINTFKTVANSFTLMQRRSKRKAL